MILAVCSFQAHSLGDRISDINLESLEGKTVSEVCQQRV